jgi:hypothetical protein
MSPLERTVSDFVNMSLSEYELPEAFYKVAVDVFNDGYGRQECVLTTLFEKPFKMDESDRMNFIMNKIKREVNEYFGNIFSHIANGSSTVSVYDENRDWYNKRKNKKLNESDESRQERNFTKLLNNIEEYINSNSYDSVVRVMVDYDEVMDDVIINIFFDAEEAVRLGGGINPVIKKTGKNIEEDLSIFPLDFKYYVHFDKRQLTESDNKKKSLLKNIRDVGLYDFIRMAGIELMDLQTQVGQIPREMLEQFIKDYVSNEGDQYSSAKPDEKIVSIDVRVGGNAIIDFMYYDGKLLSFEVTEYGNGFSKEETDQYIEGAKNYGYDTIFNIANKISRKIN